MTKYIHWWQFPLDLISIKLKRKFKDKFFEKAKENFVSVSKLASFLQRRSKLYGKNITTDYRIVWQYHKRAEYIPAWVIYEISKKIKVNLLKIEKNIQGYVSTGGKLYILEPKLPIKITPEFISIAIHGMCDGCVHKNHLSYFQKERFGLKRFTKLLFNIFGKYKLSKYKRIHYFPTIFSAIITNYFRIPTYLSAESKIPTKILKGNDKEKIAVLLAVLHDDGNVCGAVRFLSSNKKFILNLKNITKSLDYKCNISIFKQKGKMTKDHYCLSLTYDSIQKFAQDCDKLISKYPDLDIGKKLKEVKDIIRFSQRSWKRRGKFETKRIIIKALNRGPKTAVELRKIVNINLWTVYHHLQQLMKLGQITKYKKGTQSKYRLIHQ